MHCTILTTFGYEMNNEFGHKEASIWQYIHQSRFKVNTAFVLSGLHKITSQICVHLVLSRQVYSFNVFYPISVLSPVPAWALKIGVAVEFVAETPCVHGFKSSRLYAQCLVELENQVLHSLSGTDEEPRQRPGGVWLE